MRSSPCLCLAQFYPEIGGLRLSGSITIRVSTGRRYPFRIAGGGSRISDLFGRKLSTTGVDCHEYRSFAGGRTIIDAPPTRKPVVRNLKGFRVNSSLPTSSHLPSLVFTMGTVAVLPFYTLMVAAPKAEMTRKCIQSSIPFIVLGLVYACLLYLSWTPDTLRLMFASKYWLPELPGIARMFSNQMTLASAWIHLLAVDLFAARQIFQDGLANEIETRHSVSLCLLFCPVGITAHFITKALMERATTD